MLTVPLMVSQSVIQFNPVIDRAFASSLSSGSVTEFELGVRVFSAPGGVDRRDHHRATRRYLGGSVRAERLGGCDGELDTRDRGTDDVDPAACRGRNRAAQAGNRVRIRESRLLPGGDRQDRFRARDAPAWILAAVADHGSRDAIHRASRDSVPDEGRDRQLHPQRRARLGVARALGVAGITLSTSITLTILCGVYWWGANRRWGLTSAVAVAWKPTVLSFASAAAIGCASFLAVTLTGPYESRPMELGAIVCIGRSDCLFIGA